MKSNLVVGQSGLVGGELVRVLKSLGEKVVGTYKSTPVRGATYLDICGRVGFTILYLNPSIIYLPASLTNVDHCETYPEKGYETNVLGVRKVVESANKIGAKL